MTRTALPKRRQSEIIDVQYGRFKLECGIGYDDDREIKEIFIQMAKSGSELQDLARDAAVLASLALQYGCPLEVIAGALTQRTDGPAGPIGALFDEILKKEEKGQNHGNRKPPDQSPIPQ